jgi:hypothetical protein
MMHMQGAQRHVTPTLALATQGDERCEQHDRIDATAQSDAPAG